MNLLPGKFSEEDYILFQSLSGDEQEAVWEAMDKKQRAKYEQFDIKAVTNDPNYDAMPEHLRQAQNDKLQREYLEELEKVANNPRDNIFSLTTLAPYIKQTELYNIVKKTNIKNPPVISLKKDGSELKIFWNYKIYKTENISVWIITLVDREEYGIKLKSYKIDYKNQLGSGIIYEYSADEMLNGLFTRKDGLGFIVGNTEEERGGANQKNIKKNFAKIDTSKFKKEYENSPPMVKSQVDAAIKAIDSIDSVSELPF